ncbi:NAD-dependent epimerase/dehydratase family protein [Kineococcus esterisolvens]|uniref:NAD-dependent epimerase/dehydratase family protein n=1 Tax=unclassified Kineococcus TaxID=2621656 RepID=UPI003D7D8F09
MSDRVLLTGGAGLIGSTITDLLLEDPGVEAITVFDDFSRGTLANLARAVRSPHVRVVRGDVRDVAAVERVVREADVVFHLPAIRITRCASEPRLANDIIVNGTFNVLEAAAAHGVRKVVASSTASVYGMAEVFPTTERHHSYNNDTIYGAAKAYNEGLLRSFKAMHDLDYVALRYFNVYGPRMDTEGKYTEVLIRWMQAIESGQPPVVHGDGSATMDFVNVRDVARANLAAMRADVTDEVFNVARGEETSLLQLAQALLRVMGSELTVQHTDVRAVNSVPRRLADTSKAERVLGFRAETGLEEGLAELVAWWRGLGAEEAESRDLAVPRPSAARRDALAAL